MNEQDVTSIFGQAQCKMGTKLNYITFVSKEKSSKKERENWRSFSPM
jgi:hypothetical protein